VREENAVKERAMLRKMAGLTQIQLGRKVGKSGATICLWERGDLELAPADIQRIALAIEKELNKQPPISSADQIIGMFAGISAKAEAVAR
jgi:DNA-binding XRE family transcriptional regulator